MKTDLISKNKIYHWLAVNLSILLPVKDKILLQKRYFEDSLLAGDRYLTTENEGSAVIKIAKSLFGDFDSVEVDPRFYKESGKFNRLMKEEAHDFDSGLFLIKLDHKDDIDTLIEIVQVLENYKQYSVIVVAKSRDLFFEVEECLTKVRGYGIVDNEFISRFDKLKLNKLHKGQEK